MCDPTDYRSWHDRIRYRPPRRRAKRSAVSALADVLIDCVEGGASVSFMLPIERATAVAFWTNVADGVANGERILLVAEDAAGRIVGTVQVVTAQPRTSRIAPISRRCSCRGTRAGRASPRG